MIMAMTLFIEGFSCAAFGRVGCSRRRVGRDDRADKDIVSGPYQKTTHFRITFCFPLVYARAPCWYGPSPVRMNVVGLITRRAIMATKKTAARKVQAAVKKEVIRHARIELPDDDYAAVKEVARSNGLSVAAYIRMAILQRVRRDRAESEGGGK